MSILNRASENDHAAKTLQERFGFRDHDLTTPGHDEIMLWLDAHMDELAATRLGLKDSWSQDEIAGGRYDCRDLPEVLPEYPAAKVTEKRWESPVLSGKYTIGFLDMLVSISQGTLSYDKARSEYDYRTRTSLDHPARWRVCQRTVRVAFEVKTSIPSLGEIVRQIRMYQTYLSDTPFFVVSPDTRWADHLRDQGIGFISYGQATG